MAPITVEELMSFLETFDAENLVRLGEFREKACLEILEKETGCKMGYIKIPE